MLKKLLLIQQPIQMKIYVLMVFHYHHQLLILAVYIVDIHQVEVTQPILIIQVFKIECTEEYYTYQEVQQYT